MHILICGAGVAGLALGHCLRETGITFDIIEKAPDLRAAGYLLSVSGPGYAMAKKYGVLPGLQQRALPHQSNTIRNAKGRTLLKFEYGDLAKHVDFLTISRGDLVRTLAEVSDLSSQVAFSTTVKSIAEEDSHVSVQLSDGSRRKYDCVIGADGTHSDLRLKVFGRENTYHRYMGYCVAACIVEGVKQDSQEISGFSEAGRMCEIFYLGADKLAALFIWSEPDLERLTRQKSLEKIRELFSNLHPATQRIVENIRGDTDLYFDRMEQIVMPEWSKGRVALIGDAAWCMSLVSGQGASIAMAGAAQLAASLKGCENPQASTTVRKRQQFLHNR